MKQMIPTATLFAYATEGEALAVANKVMDKRVMVCEVRIMGAGMQPAEVPVAWVVLPKRALA